MRHDHKSQPKGFEGYKVAVVTDADRGVSGLETREAFEARGAEVVEKTPPGTRKGMFDRTDFRVDRK